MVTGGQAGGNGAGRTSVWVWAYEGTMAGLALAVLWLLTLPEEGWVFQANLAIWAVFVVDYAVRLVRAEDRRQFVRTHLVELVSIIPVDLLRATRALRFLRLLRLIRALLILWRVHQEVRGILKTNGLGCVLLVSVAVICAGGVGVWMLEERMATLEDGLWWALVTATTVGYGDISPSSPQGRLIAAGLMLVGIGAMAMITGSIATYFLARARRSGNPQVAWVKGQLDRWDAMDRQERTRLAAMLTALASLPDPGPSRGSDGSDGKERADGSDRVGPVAERTGNPDP